MAEIRTVAVLGGGLMGSGIAEIAAKSGYETIVREINDDHGEHARKSIHKSLDRAVEKGKLEATVRAGISDRIRITSKLEDLRNADIIIEAVTEDLELKNVMFRTLDDLCGANTIFASNTSSLSIAAM